MIPPPCQIGAILEQFTAGCPYLTEVATQQVLKPGYSYAAEFEFGLSLVFNGLDKASRR